MAKLSKDLHQITVLASIADGRQISKLEKILSTHGDIESEYSMRASDGRGRRPVVNIIYLVSTRNPGVLKRALVNNRLTGVTLHLL